MAKPPMRPRLCGPRGKVARWQNLIPLIPWIAPPPSTLAQSKERKGSNFAIWQPCLHCLSSFVTSIRSWRFLSAVPFFPRRSSTLMINRTRMRIRRRGPHWQDRGVTPFDAHTRRDGDRGMRPSSLGGPGTLLAYATIIPGPQTRHLLNLQLFNSINIRKVQDLLSPHGSPERFLSEEGSHR